MKANKALKTFSKKQYAEIITKPAERLLNALLEAEGKERSKKVRKAASSTTIHR